jgi:hypothetical protein
MQPTNRKFLRSDEKKHVKNLCVLEARNATGWGSI